MFSRKSLLIISFILSLIGIGAMIGIYTSGYYQPVQIPETIEGLLWPDPKQIGEFTIVDHKGKEFSSNNMQGKWSLLFFGYTYCPDVCPITLSVLNQFYNNKQRDDIQVLFITVDPERDTTTRLAEYIGYFNQDFLALGGNIEQVRTLASQIGIAFMYGAPAEDGNYLVDHTSSVFLLDPQARLVSILPAPHTPESIETRFNNIESFIREHN